MVKNKEVRNFIVMNMCVSFECMKRKKLCQELSKLEKDGYHWKCSEYKVLRGDLEHVYVYV